MPAWMPAAIVESYDPNRYSFEWNHDFTEFRAVPLRWHDDVSYQQYQCGGEEDE